MTYDDQKKKNISCFIFKSQIFTVHYRWLHDTVLMFCTLKLEMKWEYFGEIFHVQLVFQHTLILGRVYWFCKFIDLHFDGKMWVVVSILAHKIT